MAPNRPLWNWCTQINWLCWNWLSTTYGAHLFMWMDSRHCTRAVKAGAPPCRWHKISMGKSCCLFFDRFYDRQVEKRRDAAYWWNLKESLKILSVCECVYKASYGELLLVYSKCTLVMMEHRKDQYFCLVSQQKIITLKESLKLSS